jgi:putative inorganic carbon (HCO3(-)) transporter
MLSQIFQKSNLIFLFIAVCLAALAGYAISIGGVPSIAGLVVGPAILAIVIAVLVDPKIGLFLYLQLAFLVPFIGHFIPINAPIGTSVEAILTLSMLSLALNAKKANWSRLNNLAFYILLIWVAYSFLEFFNPNTPNRVPSWLYRFRSVSFQWLCGGILVSVLDITRKDVKILLVTWISWSIVAALWAFKQQYIGLTESEAVWLYRFGAKTHLLFGHLRSFSFFSDAAQLGAEMAGLTLVCMILGFETKKFWFRILFFTLTGFFFWGYAVTGTRSALFVILAGFPFYLVLKRDITKILIGGVVAAFLVFILMFTSVGNGNYQIYRMRTALRPNDDPSFQLRKANQQVLAGYLQSLPFGAGLGTSMAPGDIYNPDYWAALIAPDTWYVVIWIEAGRVGLTIYLFVLFSFIAIGSYKVFRMRDDWLRSMMIVLLAEFLGIVTMAYANTIMGQYPTSTIIFISSFLFTTCDRWADKPEPKPKLVQQLQEV